MSTDRKQATCHASLGYIRQVLSENYESGLNVLHRVWIIKIFGERITSNKLGIFSFLNHSLGVSSHTLGICPSLSCLSSPTLCFSITSHSFPSPYLLGIIVPLCMRDCFNSQSKMHELISLPLILRDMSLHEKCKTVPVTLPLSLF